MTVQTGRTVSKWLQFILGDSGNGTLRQIPINSLAACGITFDQTDLTAWMDSVKGMLPNMPSAPLDISGPYDTSVAAAVSALSGSATILIPLVGATTPLTVDVRIGIRHAWETGEPNFGITATATSGYLVTSFNVDWSTGMYSSHLDLFPGSSLPAFGTSDETT